MKFANILGIYQFTEKLIRKNFDEDLFKTFNQPSAWKTSSFHYRQRQLHYLEPSIRMSKTHSVLHNNIMHSEINYHVLKSDRNQRTHNDSSLDGHPELFNEKKTKWFSARIQSQHPVITCNTQMIQGFDGGRRVYLKLLQINVSENHINFKLLQHEATESILHVQAVSRFNKAEVRQSKVTTGTKMTFSLNIKRFFLLIFFFDVFIFFQLRGLSRWNLCKLFKFILIQKNKK